MSKVASVVDEQKKKVPLHSIYNPGVLYTVWFFIKKQMSREEPRKLFHSDAIEESFLVRQRTFQ